MNEIMSIEALRDWLTEFLVGGVRTGRISGEFVVTRAAFDALPGEPSVWTTPVGETVRRKAIRVYGAPMGKVAAIVIEPKPPEGVMLG